MRDLARLAIAAFGRQGEGSGVIGVDVQRIRRSLGLRAERAARAARATTRAATACRATRSAASRRCCARSSSARQIERTEALPPARPLNELDRALPTGPLQDLAARAPRRRPAQAPPEDAGPRERGPQAPRARRHAPDDARVAGDRRRAGRPQVQARSARGGRRSTCSATSRRRSRARSVFFLSVLHALHDSFRKMRSFVFIERISEVTDVFAARARLQGRQRGDRHATPASPTSAATPTTAASGASSATLVEDDLHPRATVIVLGDARTNGRDPRADIFATDRRARRPHVLAEPRAAPVLELRRQRDRRLRAALRGVRVLDDGPARGLRQGADAAGLGALNGRTGATSGRRSAGTTPGWTSAPRCRRTRGTRGR